MNRVIFRKLTMDLHSIFKTARNEMIGELWNDNHLGPSGNGIIRKYMNQIDNAIQQWKQNQRKSKREHENMMEEIKSLRIQNRDLENNAQLTAASHSAMREKYNKYKNIAEQSSAKTTLWEMKNSVLENQAEKMTENIKMLQSKIEEQSAAFQSVEESSAAAIILLQAEIAELRRGYWPLIYVYENEHGFMVTTIKRDLPIYKTLAGVFEDLRNEAVEIIVGEYCEFTFITESLSFISTTREV